MIEDKKLKEILEEKVNAYVEKYKMAETDEVRESTDLSVRKFIDAITDDLAYNLIYWAKYQREKLR